MANPLIFIVDQDVSSPPAIMRKLYAAGYGSIVAVESGNDLMWYLNEKKHAWGIPEVVVMETHMRGCLGYKLCKEIRKKPYGQNIAIIGMAGDADYTQQWMDAGADGFIPKKDVLSPVFNLGDVVKKAIRTRRK